MGALNAKNAALELRNAENPRAIAGRARRRACQSAMGRRHRKLASLTPKAKIAPGENRGAIGKPWPEQGRNVKVH